MHFLRKNKSMDLCIENNRELSGKTTEKDDTQQVPKEVRYIIIIKHHHRHHQ
jgi:hypothetical protein